MDNRVSLFSFDRTGSTMLKGAAILLVLLGHAGIVRMGGAGGVALFLILSGYGLNSSCESRGLKGYWRKRIRKVWLPYFFVGLLDVFVLKVRGAGAVLCTLLGLDLGLIADLTMWYISYIFYWYLAYYLASRMTGKCPGENRRRLLLTGALLLASVLGVFLGRLGFWHRGSLSTAYCICFPLGVMMSCLREFKVSRAARTGFWALVLLGCSAYLCLPYFSIPDLTYFTALSMAGAAIAVFQLLPIRGLPEKLLLLAGAYSFPIYLFEGLFRLCLPGWRQSMGFWMADLAFLAASIAAGALYWTLYRAAEKRITARTTNTENKT